MERYYLISDHQMTIVWVFLAQRLGGVRHLPAAESSFRDALCARVHAPSTPSGILQAFGGSLHRDSERFSANTPQLNPEIEKASTFVSTAPEAESDSVVGGMILLFQMQKSLSVKYAEYGEIASP